MANPNIFGSSSILGETSLLNTTTVITPVVSGESNKVKKINSIIVSNYGNLDQTFSVDMYRSTTSYPIASQVSIPSRSTLLLVGKEHSFYLLETDVLRANASANVSVTVTCSFETLS